MIHRLTPISTILLLILCFFLPTQGFTEIRVDATITPESFPQNRAAMLTVTVSGARKTSNIKLPKIENIEFHHRGQSSQISMSNGSVTSMISHNYLVQGRQSGKYTIGPIEVKAGKEILSTQPINFEITSGGQQASRPKGEKIELSDIAFIEVSELGTHYPGELVPITIKVYLDQRFRPDITTLPVLQGSGVVMEQLSTKPFQSQESLNGRAFHVITWKTHLSGIKTGEHPISFSLDGTLLIPQKRRATSPFSSFGRGSFFDDSFFDDFFNNYRRENVKISTSDLVFTVVDLPLEKQPESFTGAVGDFQLDIHASPLKVEVGEPITLTVSISGSGNFDLVEMPRFPTGKNWKIYSPSSSFEKDDSALHHGVKTFEQAIVLRDDKVQAIPALSFSYFDPERKEYISKVTPEIPLDIVSYRSTTSQNTGVDLAKPSTITPSEPKMNSQFNGLAPIQIEAGQFERNLKPLFKKTWYVATSVFLLLLSLFTAIVKYRRMRHLQHPEIELARKSKKKMQTDLIAAQSAIDEIDSQAFLSQCRKTIQNHLGQKHQRKPASISSAELSNWLEPESMLIKIFVLAEQSAYGDVTLSKGEMQEMFSKMNEEIEKIS